jgi:ketosteroid isomerase-like protein
MDPKELAIEYLDAVGKKDLGRVQQLLAADVKFTGPMMARDTAAEFVAALKRLGAIHVRNDIRRVFADGDEVCVIYDFVTDTPAGAIPTIEWLRVEGGRIRSINLYYDRVPWKGVMDAMAQRAARA